MNMKYAVMILSSTFLACNALAGTMGTTITRQQPDLDWIGTFSAGPVWESAGGTQTLYLTPEIEKAYVANNTSHTLFDGEVFLGIQKALSQIFKGQLGLAVATTNNATLPGIIWEDADPAFDNYTYNYKIQHTHLAVKGKLLADTDYWLVPWISGSIGLGFNNAHDFLNTPTLFEAVPDNNFSSHTTTSFIYTLGVGLQKELTRHWQVGLGYEFSDWGKNQLGRAEGQTVNTGITLNHLYTNGVLFNITYTR